MLAGLGLRLSIDAGRVFQSGAFRHRAGFNAGYLTEDLAIVGEADIARWTTCRPCCSRLNRCSYVVMPKRL
jgi:hypothetical protein